MASINALPDTKNVAVSVSTASTIFQGFQQKYVPKNPDGTIFDCTTYSSPPSLNIATPTASAPDTRTSFACSFQTGDATGIVILVDETQAQNICNALAAGNYPYSITASTGSDIATVGKGFLAVSTLT